MTFDPLWLPDATACHHGSRCSCRALARAMGVPESGVDFNYCRRVLQKHWRMSCDHLPQLVTSKPNIHVPPHDSSDPVHMLLIANADRDADDPAPEAGWSPSGLDAPSRFAAH